CCYSLTKPRMEVVLCGGSESMSQAPYAVRNIRFGTKFGVDLKMEDTLWAGLTDQHVKIPMGITAENLADKYQITREECDKYAHQTQQRWKAAHEGGHFTAEIAPIDVKAKKGTVAMAQDEHPRPQTTLEQMAKLPPVFKKGGTVTAANASGVSDGAAAVVIASEDALKEHKLKPLARIVAYHVSGCDPSIMGIGPVPAITEALKKAGLSLKDMDLVEVCGLYGSGTLLIVFALAQRTICIRSSFCLPHVATCYFFSLFFMKIYNKYCCIMLPCFKPCEFYRITGVVWWCLGP
uniref:Acetyl-CoA acyltransferase 2 n=1 Tax=Myripristis murdjan TaxID=586833 RepID=A0A667Y8J6_9TELE